MRKLDIHPNSRVFEDHIERSEIWSMSTKDVKADRIVAQALTLIEKDAYRQLKMSEFPDKPSSFT